MVDMISIFDPAVCRYTLAYYSYDIDVGAPRAILEANGNFERIQPFKNFSPASSMARGVPALISLVFKMPKMKSLGHMEKVMYGQSCRFWPFGAVENKGLLAAHSRRVA